MEQHKTLINKMKAHDWYYEHSEDHKAYVKGVSERAEIYEMFAKVPAKEIECLILDHVPKDVQHQFVAMLVHFNRSAMFLKERL